MNNVNSVVENEMNRFEKVITAVEKHQLSTMEENNKSIDEFRKEVSRAKNSTEEILARKLENIDAHIKIMDSDLNKCQYDWKERCDGLAAELKVMEVQMSSQMAGLKDMFQDGDTNLDARI